MSKCISLSSCILVFKACTKDRETCKFIDVLFAIISNFIYDFNYEREIGPLRNVFFQKIVLMYVHEVANKQ